MSINCGKITDATLDIGSPETGSTKYIIDYIAKYINTKISPDFGALADWVLE